MARDGSRLYDVTGPGGEADWGTCTECSIIPHKFIRDSSLDDHILVTRLHHSVSKDRKDRVISTRRILGHDARALSK